MSAQREIPLLGAARQPSLVPWELLRSCRNALDAVRLCVQLSHMSNDALCRRLGVDPGHWTRIMQGRAHFPTRKLPALMEAAGNLAPVQYLAMAMGLQLQVPVDRIAELEAELAALRGPQPASKAA